MLDEYWVNVLRMYIEGWLPIEDDYLLDVLRSYKGVDNGELYSDR